MLELSKDPELFAKQWKELDERINDSFDRYEKNLDKVIEEIGGDDE